ncbi:hypothetical protein SERLA73DRAFT_74088 [Serpula lacrymans var. lacrymans S7.3]|uniref:Uncharacterized protein n=2 Tax=Serpula lacrymans var. lacrymans TaxID=341189 RepID=F8Q0J8_SERL3|nr:uncharacterized protein SERLADRAFT_438726 [Serpula lacrymans var. lacrymans S7.9]EGN97827.1 hypothetical protein SERLA73DRAFT_74088 [Serpula lacrymans var. lacrymans S7.3]EGO23419.1 hypothetical protein SERLADRAFT_438726 [Serpula lacrymans var. lacrymans S7.9]
MDADPGSVLSITPFRALSPKSPRLSAALLPADILLPIFHIAVFQHDLLHRGTVPVILSHVCKTWRDLAINTPTLWTTIVSRRPGIPPSLQAPEAHGHKRKTDPLDAFPLIKIFLSRSRDCPLNIYLDLSWCNSNEAIPEVPQVGDTPFAILDIIAPRLGSVKEFEARSLSHATTSITRDKPTPHSILRSISLCRVHTEWSRWSVTNLTSLTIDYLAYNTRPSLDDLRHILMAISHTLEYLRLYGVIPEVIRGSEPTLPATISSMVTLPKVRELGIGYTHPIEALAFLHAFHFPSLTSLAFEDVYRRLQHDKISYHEAIMALRINIDHGQRENDASFLLHAMVNQLPIPLNKIKFLKLSSVCLCSWQPCKIGMTSNQQPPVSPWAKFTNHWFLLSMPSLVTLVLDFPDAIILDCLNTGFPRCSYRGEGESRLTESFSFPVEQLSELHIQNVNLETLASFLRCRTLMAARTGPWKVPVWDRLELPIKWRDMKTDFQGNLETITRQCWGTTPPTYDSFGKMNGKQSSLENLL